MQGPVHLRSGFRAAFCLLVGAILASLALEDSPVAHAALFSVPWDVARDVELMRRHSVSVPTVGAAASERTGRGDTMPLSSSPPAVDIVRRVANPHNWIAITFDACATQNQPNGFDEPLFGIVQREHLPATIFTSGRWVESHPDAMKRIVAEPLIELANHSYGHPHMTRLSADEIASELERTEEALARYGRQSVAFRPPFGEFNGRVLEVARNKHIPPVLWDVVSGDPSAKVTAEGMTRTVLRQTRSGSIVIFHINGRAAQTATALPGILQQLRARGFQFVPLSKLLAARSAAGAPDVLAGVSVPVADRANAAAVTAPPFAPPSAGTSPRPLGDATRR